MFRLPLQLSLTSSRIILQSNSRLLFNFPKLLVSEPFNKPYKSSIRYSANLGTDSSKQDLTSPADQKKLILTIPNLLTSLRIASIPFINYYFFNGRHDIACGLFVMASLTDFLDGYIARNFPNQLSHLGSILDPLADKLLIGMFFYEVN